jgi:hypothetical protein
VCIINKLQNAWCNNEDNTCTVSNLFLLIVTSSASSHAIKFYTYNLIISHLTAMPVTVYKFTVILINCRFSNYIIIDSDRYKCACTHTHMCACTHITYAKLQEWWDDTSLSFVFGVLRGSLKFLFTLSLTCWSFRYCKQCLNSMLKTCIYWSSPNATTPHLRIVTETGAPSEGLAEVNTIGWNHTVQLLWFGSQLVDRELCAARKLRSLFIFMEAIPLC